MIPRRSARERDDRAGRDRALPVLLADYRRKKPVVVVFYRGYW